MQLKAFKTELREILPLREFFLQENNFLIRYNACHERGWSDSYLLTVDDVKIGYGSVKGKGELTDRDAVFEFYVLPLFRKIASLMFPELLAASGAAFIECQSNDILLSSMLYEFSHNINANVILFEDHVATEHPNPGVIFRLKKDDDHIFEHTLEVVGTRVLELNGEVVATGGFLLHYNMPFADLHIEVKENHRRKGLATYLLQEVKKECYRAGRVSAARCDIQNHGSRGALLKAGMRVCGFMLTGEIKA